MLQRGKKVRLLIFIAMLCSLLLRCNDSTPIQPMSTNDFIVAYAEYLFIITQDTTKAESRTIYLRNVLAEQGKTLEEFSETWKTLNTKPEQWADIMKEVSEKMQEKKVRSNQEQGDKISKSPGSAIITK